MFCSTDLFEKGSLTALVVWLGTILRKNWEMGLGDRLQKWY